MARSIQGVKLLVEHGTPVNAFDWSPLMVASLFGAAEIVEYLIEHGADVNHFTDPEEREKREGCSTTNSLMLAIGNEHLEVVRILIRHGADVDLKNNADRNALNTVEKVAKTERFPGRLTAEQREELITLVRQASKTWGEETPSVAYYKPVNSRA